MYRKIATDHRCARTGKVRFRSEKDARYSITRSKNPNGPIRTYPCEFCGGWHTTSREEYANPKPRVNRPDRAKTPPRRSTDRDTAGTSRPPKRGASGPRREGSSPSRRPKRP
jgi:hypothetical protein